MGLGFQVQDDDNADGDEEKSMEDEEDDYGNGERVGALCSTECWLLLLNHGSRDLS